jgi:hypothetical protein
MAKMRGKKRPDREHLKVLQVVASVVKALHAGGVS